MSTYICWIRDSDSLFPEKRNQKENKRLVIFIALASTCIVLEYEVYNNWLLFYTIICSDWNSLC